MALLDKGDTVLVGAPTYMMALHVFRTYEARIVPVPLDDQGLDPEALDSVSGSLTRKACAPGFSTRNPSFQNPSGRTMDLQRRGEARGALPALPGAHRRRPRLR